MASAEFSGGSGRRGYAVRHTRGYEGCAALCQPPERRRGRHPRGLPERDDACWLEPGGILSF